MQVYIPSVPHSLSEHAVKAHIVRLGLPAPCKLLIKGDVFKFGIAYFHSRALVEKMLAAGKITWPDKTVSTMRNIYPNLLWSTLNANP